MDLSVVVTAWRLTGNRLWFDIKNEINLLQRNLKNTPSDLKRLVIHLNLHCFIKEDTLSLYLVHI